MNGSLHLSGLSADRVGGQGGFKALHLTMYALLLRRQGLLKAFRQGQEARAIADSYPDCREFANCYNVLCDNDDVSRCSPLNVSTCIGSPIIGDRKRRGGACGLLISATVCFAENSRGANLEIQQISGTACKIHLQQFREKHFSSPAEFIGSSATAYPQWVEGQMGWTMKF